MFSLQVITQSKIVYSGEVSQVQFATPRGKLTVLADHTPIVTQLEVCKLEVTDPSGKLTWLVLNGGLAYYAEGKLSILTDDAQLGHELDTVKIQQAIENAKTKMYATAEKPELIKLEKTLQYELFKARLTEQV